MIKDEDLDLSKSYDAVLEAVKDLSFEGQLDVFIQIIANKMHEEINEGEHSSILLKMIDEVRSHIENRLIEELHEEWDVMK